jgi:hypothetical protein
MTSTRVTCPIHDAGCPAVSAAACPAVSALVSAVVLLVTWSGLPPLTPNDPPVSGTGLSRD